MRRILIVALAGCGRFGFGAQLDATVTDGDVGDADAPSDTAALCTPVGHDEDGDTIDDACDVCPHIADAAQADGDGDRVGDGCDPAPASPTERIMFFDPFVVRRPEWTFGNVVELGDDKLLIGELTSSSQIRLSLSPAFDTFAASGRTLDVGNGRRILALSLDNEPASYYCEFLNDTDVTFKYTYTFDQVMYVDASTPVSEPLAMRPWTMRMSRTPSSVQCTGSLGGSPYMHVGTAPAIDATSIVLRFLFLTGEIDYFIWIRSE